MRGGKGASCRGSSSSKRLLLFQVTMGWTMRLVMASLLLGLTVVITGNLEDDSCVYEALSDTDAVLCK